MPVVLFALLYVTFCKIEIKEMKPKAWHFVSAAHPHLLGIDDGDCSSSSLVMIMRPR